MQTINLAKDQSSIIQDSVKVAGKTSPKRSYSYSEVSRKLSEKDRDSNYTIKSFDSAMELFVSDSKLGTKAFKEERWEIVKIIFRCFHTATCGMPMSLIEQYQPVETGEEIRAAIEKKMTKIRK